MKILCLDRNRPFRPRTFKEEEEEKLSSLQRYDTEQNYRSLHKVVQRFSQLNHKITNHHHIQKQCVENKYLIS
jgi:hypothetical protein